MTEIKIISDACTVKVMASEVDRVFICPSYVAVEFATSPSANLMTTSNVKFALHTEAQEAAFRQWWSVERKQGYSFVVKPECMQVIKNGYEGDVFTMEYPNTVV